MTEYSYDVAFSFLNDDDAAARKIDKALEQLTLKRFLYSDRQKELAGADGVELLPQTFRRQSRVVVVLHRKGWGSTKWTAVEASAIRSRAFDDMNFDSVLFVPLDDSPLPDWVPPTRIWFDLGKFGAETLAAAIAQKAKEAGSEVRRIGIAERGVLAAKRLAFESERQRFLGPDGGGIAVAHSAAEELQKEVQRLAAEASVPPTLTLKYEQTTKARGGRGEGAVVGHLHSVDFVFRPQYANSLDGAELIVQLWQGPSPFLDRWFADPAKPLGKWKFEFDLTEDGSVGWRGNGSETVVGSKELAEWIIDQLLGAISKGSRR